MILAFTLPINDIEKDIAMKVCITTINLVVYMIAFVNYPCYKTGDITILYYCFRASQ